MLHEWIWWFIIADSSENGQETTLGCDISVRCIGCEWETQKHHASSTCATIEENFLIKRHVFVL
jgi:hypothetical protein